MVLHVAIVHAGGEICHVTADTSTEGLTRRLAAYVREQVRYQLPSADAARVLALLSEGSTEQAVELYFANVGRWDPERLVIRRLDLSDAEGPALPEGSDPGAESTMEASP